MKQHQCELEKIAETSTVTEIQDNCIDQTKIAYLECADCKKIYSETTEARTYEGYNTPGTKMISRAEYSGKLSKEELTKHVSKHIGTITQQDEQKIIKLRN